MKRDTTLAAGARVSTLGYYSADDGGAAAYEIVSAPAKPQEYYNESLNNGLYAKLKISSTVSILQFGARVGSGETTSAINNAAIEAAIKFVPVHGTVYFPAKGTYPVSKAITVNRPVRLYSDYCGFDIEGITGSASLSEYTSALIMTTSQDFGISVNAPGVILENISVRCNINTSHIICVIYSDRPLETSENNMENRNLTLRNVVLTGCYDNKYTNTTVSGIYVAGGLLTTIFERVVVYDCQRGFWIESNAVPPAPAPNSTSLVFNQCWAVNCTVEGYTLQKADYCTFISCAADSKKMQYGYGIRNSHNITMIACGSELALVSGIYCENSTQISINATIAGSSLPNEKTINGIQIVNGNAVINCCRVCGNRDVDLAMTNGTAVIMMSEVKNLIVNGVSRWVNGILDTIM